MSHFISILKVLRATMCCMLYDSIFYDVAPCPTLCGLFCPTLWSMLYALCPMSCSYIWVWRKGCERLGDLHTFVNPGTYLVYTFLSILAACFSWLIFDHPPADENHGAVVILWSLDETCRDRDRVTAWPRVLVYATIQIPKHSPVNNRKDLYVAHLQSTCLHFLFWTCMSVSTRPLHKSSYVCSEHFVNMSTHGHFRWMRRANP